MKQQHDSESIDVSLSHDRVKQDKKSSPLEGNLAMKFLLKSSDISQLIFQKNQTEKGSSRKTSKQPEQEQVAAKENKEDTP